jgi:hypothetical protein
MPLKPSNDILNLAWFTGYVPYIRPASSVIKLIHDVRYYLTLEYDIIYFAYSSNLGRRNLLQTN